MIQCGDRGALTPRPLTTTPVKEAKMAKCKPNTHGHATQKHGRTPTYRAWRSIIQRCYQPKQKAYSAYGGAGITVCERWHSFPNFLEDMGPKPDWSHSIDRIDSTGNYEPGNCRWATNTQQARNRSITRRITYNGQTRPVAEWAEIIGISYNTLRRRLRLGWDLDAVMTTPILTHQQISQRGAKARFG